jgi:hypothetical protein
MPLWVEKCRCNPCYYTWLCWRNLYYIYIIKFKMTNKLLVTINSLKYQKLRKFYCMKWNFLYQIQLPPEPLTRGLPPPPDPRSLRPVLNWICWTPPRTKFLGTPPTLRYIYINTHISRCSDRFHFKLVFKFCIVIYYIILDGYPYITSCVVIYKL